AAGEPDSARRDLEGLEQPGQRVLGDWLACLPLGPVSALDLDEVVDQIGRRHLVHGVVFGDKPSVALLGLAVEDPPNVGKQHLAGRGSIVADALWQWP